MKIPSTITSLIFDLGGVLVNLDWERSVKSFTELGVEDITEVLSTTHQKGFLLDYELGRITTEEYREQVRSLSNKTLGDQEIDDAFTNLLVDLPQEKLDLLLALKKHYKVFMLSNINELSFEYIKNHYFEVNGKKMSDYFDTCYLSFEMEMIKPDDRIYQAILEENALSIEECMFFDDSLANVEAARELGIHSVVIEPYSSIDLEF